VYKGSEEAVKKINRIAAYVAIIVALSLPSIYFGLSYGYQAGILQADAEFNGYQISQIISATPNLWQFQINRLDEIINRQSDPSEKFHRQILDAKVNTVVKNGTGPLYPYMERTKALYDSGVQVESVEVSRSLRPLTASTGLVALLSIMLGGLIFFPFRNLSLLALRRAWGQLARSNEIAEITANIAKAVGSTLEPDELFRIIAREIRRAVPCERCVIALVEEKSMHYRYLHLESDIEVRGLTPQESTRKAERYYNEIYKPKQIVNIPELKEEHSFWTPHIREMGFRSYLSAPILQNGQCVAHVAISSTRVNAFTAAHESFFTAISGHLGSAIRNASLYQEAQDRASRLAEAQRIAHIGNWEWNTQTNDSLWSDGFYRIFGLSPEETTPSRDVFFNSIHPEDRELVLEATNKALHMEEALNINSGYFVLLEMRGWFIAKLKYF
jgi:GAF domain-containing protein